MMPARRGANAPRAQAQAPAQAHTPAYKSQLGNGSAIPNLYWTAVPRAQLRQYHSGYVGLPADCEITQPITYRYVRQESPLWSELRRGRLTTAQLGAALGFQEPGTSKAVSVSKSWGAIVNAYSNLMEPTWSHDTANDTQGAKHAASSVLDSAARNETVRLRLHGNKSDINKLPPGGLWDGATPGSAESAKRTVCEQVGLRGELSCRLYWGNVQEPSALDALTQLFPHAYVEEVGLLTVDPATLPAVWGCTIDGFPALGASPDALICHWLPITSQAIMQARMELGLFADATGDAHLLEEAGQKALELLTKALEAVPLGPLETSTDTDTPLSAQAPHRFMPVPLTHTNDDSVRQLAHIILEPPPALLPTPTQQQDPSITAVPEHQPSGQQAGDSADSSSGPEQPSAGSRKQHTEQQQAGSSEQGGGVSQGTLVVDGQQGCVWVPWREVVEIKNHCPFALLEHRKARGGRTMLKYSVRESEPRKELRPAWIPQIQWHCLAAGTHSALLLSRTPSKGVALFRIRRDDDFLRQAVCLVTNVHTAYSAKGSLPPQDIMRQPEYNTQHKALVAATIKLASSCSLVGTRPGHYIGIGQHIKPPKGSDRNSTWTVTGQ